MDPTTPLDSVLHLIGAEGFAHALLNIVALEESAKIRPDDYANLLPTVQYGLSRLQRFQQLQIEIERHLGRPMHSASTIDRAQIQEALGYVADVRGYVPLVRTAMEQGQAVDAQVEPVDRLLRWLKGMHLAYARVEGSVRAFEGEFAMSVLVADYILGRCQRYLADYFRTHASYEDFRVDERTPRDRPARPQREDDEQGLLPKGTQRQLVRAADWSVLNSVCHRITAELID